MANIPDHVKKSEWRPAAASILVLVLLFGILLVLYDVFYPADLGLRQPIPFSHRVHVHTKQISCLMCHTGVTRSSRAGIPPLQTCLLCHSRIIRTFPYIVQLREHFRQGKPVVWERVNWLPEFVYFTHCHAYSAGDRLRQVPWRRGADGSGREGAEIRNGVLHPVSSGKQCDDMTALRVIDEERVGALLAAPFFGRQGRGKQRPYRRLGP